MNDIILVAINSRYTHTSLGVKYIYANLRKLKSCTEILEFVINEQIQPIAEKIVAKNPKIVGIGVYIWNALDVKELIEIIKKVAPKIKIVLGGPEVSHQPFRVNFDKADFIISGEGEISFYNLCCDILNQKELASKIIPPQMPNLKEINLPYKYYTSHDIENRYIYVETSRGCPFECEFCLSAIEKRVRNFDMDKILNEFEILWQRGVRNFKFTDRTFNLNIKLANRLIDISLRERGFEVFNLGVNTYLEEFIDALIETDADVLLISSLNGEAEGWR
jgi:radical SAM superfamily enzyme YgiQ (UPF0313 family)